MADDILTISDHVADALDLSDAEVSDLLRDAPFFARLPVVMSSNGDTHKYAKETGAPVVGFRAENAGRDFDHSADTIVTVTLKILDFSWAVDKAVADAWRQGGAQALVAREGRRHLRSAFFTAEQQYINGVGADAAGFAGLADNAQLDAVADAMVVDAGGSTADVNTSIYLIREGEDDCAGVMKGEGIELGETIVQDMLDGSSQHFPAYYTPGCSWIGLQIGAAKSVCRICNVNDTDSGKDATDDLIYKGIEQFPAGRPPTVILMNRQSLRQLRGNRTATNATGTPAPPPTDVYGIPIQLVESIGNTEAVVS